MVVLLIDADDLVETRFRHEAERRGAVGFESGRPAGDDSCDRLVGLAADETDRAFASRAAKRLNLLADRRRNARQRQVSSGAEPREVERGGMQEEADRRARRGVPMSHALVDRKDRLAAAERL